MWLLFHVLFYVLCVLIMIPFKVFLKAIFFGIFSMVIGFPSNFFATEIILYFDKDHSKIINNFNEYIENGIYLSFLLSGFITYLVVLLIKKGCAGDLEGSINIMGIDVAIPTETLSRLRSTRNLNRSDNNPSDNNSHISRVSRIDLEQQQRRQRRLPINNGGSGKSIQSEPICSSEVLAPERGIQTSNSF